MKGVLRRAEHKSSELTSQLHVKNEELFQATAALKSLQEMLEKVCVARSFPIIIIHHYTLLHSTTLYYTHTHTHIHVCICTFTHTHVQMHL